MERYKIRMAEDGQILVDKSQVFQQEKGRAGKNRAHSDQIVERVDDVLPDNVYLTL